MPLTHEQMVIEALSTEQADCKYTDEMTNQDIQVYIYMNFQEQMSTGEISDIRFVVEQA